MRTVGPSSIRGDEASTAVDLDRQNTADFSCRLHLNAECDRCGLKTEHKLRLQARVGADWLERAQSAESSLQKRILLDPRWAKCSHKGGTLRPNRTELERAVAGAGVHGSSGP